MDDRSGINEEEGIIGIEFFPIYDGVNEEGKLILKENIESQCSVKCKQIKFTVIA